MRRTLAIVTVAAVIVPPAPATAAPTSQTWSLVSNDVTFKRGRQVYTLSVSVQENIAFGASTESVRVSIARSRDPKGVRHARQRHTFEFSALDGTFGGARNLSSATVRTRRQLGDLGRLSLTFTKDTRVRRSCGGHARSRAGTLSGSLQLNTGAKRLGTVRAVPQRAILSYRDNQCQEGIVIGGPCPTRGRGVGTFPGPNSEAVMAADKPVRSKTATVTVLWSENLNDERTRSLHHELVVQLPSRKVKVAKNLGSATIRGAKRTWLSGKLRFTADTAKTTLAPEYCGPNSSRQATSSYRQGHADGILRVKSWLGSGVRIRNTSAAAGKLVVRKS